jgi:uncharacterized protein YciI
MTAGQPAMPRASRPAAAGTNSAPFTRPLKEDQMRVALMAHDKPGALGLRTANRQAHLDYIRTTGVVEMAGPLIGEDGAMCGSLVILDVPDMAAARHWAAHDPYALAGLFATTTLIEWKKVIG